MVLGSVPDCEPPFVNTTLSSAVAALLTDQSLSQSDQDNVTLNDGLASGGATSSASSVIGAGLIVLSLTTFIGNAMVMHAFRIEKRLQTVSNMFIMSLAAADLIVGLLVMPLGSWYVIKGEWVLGVIVCRLWLIVDYTASTASILNLCILSLDRYWSITAPLRYLRRRTKRRALAMITSVWLLSSCWIWPVLFWTSTPAATSHVGSGNSACETGFAANWIFKLVTATLNFYIPWLWMVFLYARMFSVIRRRARLEVGRFNQGRGRTHSYREPIGPASDTAVAATIDAATSAPQITPPLGRIRRCSSAGNYDQLILVTLPSIENQKTKCGDRRRMNKLQRYRGVSVRVQEANSNVDHDRQLQETCLDKTALSTAAYNTDKTCHSSGSPRMTLSAPLDRAQLGGSLVKSRRTRRASTDNIILQREKKAAVQLSVIMGAFVLCWLPYSLLFVVVAMCDDCVSQTAYMSAIWLGYLNSTLNPILYPLCNANFKQAFRRMITRRSQTTRGSLSTRNDRANPQ